METNRTSLWLIFASQALFLLSSLIEPPSTLLLIILRVILPLVMVVYFGLMLAGYISPKKR